MQTSTDTSPKSPADGQDHPRPNRLRNLSVVCLVTFAIGFIGFFSYVTFQIAERDVVGQSAPNDISVFWAAARIALEGSPIAAFDQSTLEQARNLPAETPEAGRRMAWSYPPQFHALILPLGLMSFNLAWLAFALVGVTAFWFGIKRLVPETTITIIAVASPAALVTANQGQNTLLVAALLCGFLASLRDRRHLLAGVFLAALTIKPQFGPLLPLVLIATGAWRVLGWGVVAGLVLLAMTLLWVGPDYWQEFFRGLSLSSERIVNGWLPRHLMITWYAFAISAGFSHESAFALQVGASVAIASSLIWLWRRQETPFALKGAALAFAIPLVSPYSYFYDLVVPMIGVALMLQARMQQSKLAAAGIGLIWALPTFGHFARALGSDQAFALLGAPVLTIGFLLVTWPSAITSRARSP